MNDFPFLLVLLLLPLLAGLGLLAVPKDRPELIRRVTLGVSLVVLVLSVLMTVAFEPSGARFQFVQSYKWIPDFGVRFSLGVDGAVNGLAAGLGGTSGRLRRTQTGFVRSYALSMLGGTLVVLVAFLAVRFV